MESGRNRSVGAGLPSPFPEGWYFVATRRQVLKERLFRKTWMGEEVVVWADGSGSICVADAYCPHLGSNLGPAAGGRVCDGRLICPFHGYEYDATGQCVATPYAEAPRKARLAVFETREICGLVFAWWGLNGRGPQWSLPAEAPEQASWSNIEARTVRFPGHPQETTENSVDLAHFRYVHGYDSFSRSAPVFIDRHCLHSEFDFLSRRRVLKGIGLTLDLSAHTLVCGLGYSFVEIREKSIGLDMRLWVLATPVDGMLVDLTLACQVREIKGPRRWFAGLGFLPVRLRAPVMTKLMLVFQKQDVLQDVVIWSRKKYVARPRLCRSDGEVMPFRAFCAQFYADRQDPAASVPAEPEAPVSVSSVMPAIRQ